MFTYPGTVTCTVYLESRRDATSLSALWMTYLDLVEVILALIRISREGNWMCHLAAIRQMTPWCFAYDEGNYAQFHYYASMTPLPVEHLDVCTKFN